MKTKVKVVTGKDAPTLEMNLNALVGYLDYSDETHGYVVNDIDIQSVTPIHAQMGVTSGFLAVVKLYYANGEVKVKSIHEN